VPLMIVRFTATARQQPEVEEAVAELFDAVREAAPPGIRYVAIRDASSPDYELLLHLDPGVDNPLPGIPVAGAFRAKLAEWAPAQSAPRPAQVLGHYGFDR